MSRTSNDQFERAVMDDAGHYHAGRLLDGYDYHNQAWVKDGRYLRCGHPDTMICDCYGREHMGEPTTNPAVTPPLRQEKS